MKQPGSIFNIVIYKQKWIYLWTFKDALIMQITFFLSYPWKNEKISIKKLPTRIKSTLQTLLTKIQTFFNTDITTPNSFPLTSIRAREISHGIRRDELEASRGAVAAVPSCYVEEVTRPSRPRGLKKNEDIPCSVGGAPPRNEPGSGFGYTRINEGGAEIWATIKLKTRGVIPILESVTR